MIDAPVKIRGGVQGALSISAVYSTDGRKVDLDGLSTKAKLKKEKIARPPNAFILYRQHHHAKVVAQYPQLHNNQICKSFQFINSPPIANGQTAIILGQQWQNEKDEVKAQFKATAEEIKKKHLNAHPDYQYQPRKPTERKRRMTRRKVERLAAGAQVVATTDPNPEAISETVLAFNETSMGNAVFTLGDDLIDEDALLAMLDKHNGDVASAGTPFREVAPTLWHETPSEVMDDINFYGNLLDFDSLYQDEYDAEELVPAETTAADTTAAAAPMTVAAPIAVAAPQVQGNAPSQTLLQQQNAALARFSTLWGPPT